MRLPLAWLHEHCAPDLDPAALAERLDLTGTKVERIERHGVDALEHFVVGLVTAAEAHPDADRLTVCRVDVGGGEEATIVCGAPNVAAGQTVAVARPGAVNRYRPATRPAARRVSCRRGRSARRGDPRGAGRPRR